MVVWNAFELLNSYVKQTSCHTNRTFSLNHFGQYFLCETGAGDFSESSLGSNSSICVWLCLITPIDWSLPTIFGVVTLLGQFLCSQTFRVLSTIQGVSKKEIFNLQISTWFKPRFSNHRLCSNWLSSSQSCTQILKWKKMRQLNLIQSPNMLGV